jgi:membrane protease YdiL (CAAX protease family)
LRARAVFAALVALVAFYGAVVVVALGIALLVPQAWLVGSLGLAVGTLPVVVAGFAVSVILVLRGWSTWRQLGWRGGPADPTALGAGVAVGVVMAASALAITVAVGGARIAITAEPASAYVAVALQVGFGLVVAALAEELLFRG